MLILVPLLLVSTAGAADAEWRAELGTQIDADSHAIANLGVRSGDWSAQLITDTVDLRWTPSSDQGRAWVALRGELGATGLFISPWIDGAPAPEHALLSHSVGTEAGLVRYLALGFYVGAQAALRYQSFGRSANTTVAVPGGRPVASADVLLGWWSEDASLWVRTGADAWLDPLDPNTASLSPHAHLQAQASAPWALSPAVELRAGVASHQDDLTRTRLGGLNPYVVPLAGAAWAEWWVEDYAALRLGLRAQATLGNHGLLVIMPFSDAAVAAEISSRQPSGPWAVGFGLSSKWLAGRSHLELTAGLAPWITRAPDISPASVYLLAGVDWGRGARLWRPKE